MTNKQLLMCRRCKWRVPQHLSDACKNPCLGETRQPSSPECAFWATLRAGAHSWISQEAFLADIGMNTEEADNFYMFDPASPAASRKPSARATSQKTLLKRPASASGRKRLETQCKRPAAAPPLGTTRKHKRSKQGGAQWAREYRARRNGGAQGPPAPAS
jgi:hypothetical protein